MNVNQNVATVEPAFVLLFSIRPKGAFKGFDTSHPGVAPLPSAEAQAYMTGLTEFERRLLGKAFLETRRITRWPLGRIALAGLAEKCPRPCRRLSAQPQVGRGAVGGVDARAGTEL